MPFRQIINLVNFAMKNQMPGDPFRDSKSILRDAVNQCLAPQAHADFIDAYWGQTGPVYVLDVHAPFMPQDSFVNLFFELDPDEQKWMMLARFVPKNGQSSIRDFLHDRNITGSGAIHHLVWNVAHKACIDKVKKSLQIDQKVTMNTDSLEPLGEKLPMETFSYSDVNVQSGQWVSSRSCGEIVAEHLDELTVTGISEHGDVTFEERNRKIPFTLTAEEAVAMLHL